MRSLLNLLRLGWTSQDLEVLLQELNIDYLDKNGEMIIAKANLKKDYIFSEFRNETKMKKIESYQNKGNNYYFDLRGIKHLHNILIKSRADKIGDIVLQNMNCKLVTSGTIISSHSRIYNNYVSEKLVETNLPSNPMTIRDNAKLTISCHDECSIIVEYSDQGYLHGKYAFLSNYQKILEKSIELKGTIYDFYISTSDLNCVIYVQDFELTKEISDIFAKRNKVKLHPGYFYYRSTLENPTIVIKTDAFAEIFYRSIEIINY